MLGRNHYEVVEYRLYQMLDSTHTPEMQIPSHPHHLSSLLSLRNFLLLFYYASISKFLRYRHPQLLWVDIVDRKKTAQKVQLLKSFLHLNYN